MTPAGLLVLSRADIVRLMGKDARVTEDPQRIRPKGSEVMRLIADASKLSERTGWKPAHTRDDGLRKTIEWFLEPANLAQYKPNQYNQ